MATNTYLLTITLNVNGLNTPIKRHGVTEWIKTQDALSTASKRLTSDLKDTCRVKVGGWGNTHHENECEKKARVAILTSD